MHPVEKCLSDLRDVESTGGMSPETAYYGALKHLINEVGKKLKPKLRYVSQLQDTGAGSPDSGLMRGGSRARHLALTGGIKLMPASIDQPFGGEL